MHHAGSALKSLLCDVLTSCMCQLIKPCIPTVCPLQDLRDSFTLVSNQSSTDYFHRNRRAFDTGDTPQIRSPCWGKTSRTAFRLRRRPELCLSISQQPTAVYGISASPTSYCDSDLTETWSEWSWRWLAIAASPLPPVTTNGVDYNASKIAIFKIETTRSPDL